MADKLRGGTTIGGFLAWHSGNLSPTISGLTDTTITSIASGEILKYDGVNWINNTLAEAGIQPAGSYQAAGTYNTIIGTDTDLDTAGATVIDTMTLTDGVVQGITTRTLTLGDLGYTAYTHPTHPGQDIALNPTALTGASVFSDINVTVTTDTLGHVTAASANVTNRTLTLANLGYTGAVDANKYVLPTSVVHDTESGALHATDALRVSGKTLSLYKGDGTFESITTQDTVYTHPTNETTNIDTSGATIVDSITTTSEGHISAMGTRVLTLGDLGYTGSTTANNYTLPVATASLGGVKTGTDITVDGSGNVSINNDSHLHSYLDGSVLSNLDTAVNDVGVFKYQSFTGTATNKPVDLNNANGVLTMTSHTGPYGRQIAFADNENLYTRKIANNVYGTWRTLWSDANLVFGTASNNMAPGNHTHSIYALSAGSTSQNFSTNDLTVTGTFTVTGGITEINSTTLTVDDKNIELGTVTTPTDITADGGGITLKGATDKTILWTNATDRWTFNQGIEAPSFVGPLTGIASQVTVSDHTANNTNYPLVWHNNSSSLFDTVSKLTFNPSTGTIASTNFSGNGSGLTSLTATALTGTIADARLPATISSDITGNAATSTEAPKFITGTGTVAGTWLGSHSDITAYTDGLTISYITPPVAGAAITTLNINGLGAVDCYVRNTTKLTTHYQPNSFVTFVYSATLNGGSFLAQTYYDSNETYTVRWNMNVKNDTDIIHGHKLVFETPTGTFAPVTVGSSLAVDGNVVSSKSFRIGAQMLYYNSTTDIAASSIFTTVYEGITSTAMEYWSNKGTVAWATSNMPFYVVGTPDSTGTTFTLDGAGTSTSTFLTQTLPTTEDGKIYIQIGYMYDTADAWRLSTHHPIYEYRNGAIGEYTPKITKTEIDALDVDAGTLNTFDDADFVKVNSASASAEQFVDNFNMRKYINFNDYDDTTGANTGLRTYVRDGEWFIGADTSETNPVKMTLSGDSSLFTARQFESTVPTGNAPFTVASTTKVANLNADLLDGQTGSFYQDATNINAGTLNKARLPATIDADTNGTAAVATVANTIANASSNVAGNIAFFVNDGGGNLGMRFNATSGGTNTLVEDGQAWEMQIDNDAVGGNFNLYRGTTTGGLLGETITWSNALTIDGSTGNATFENNIYATGTISEGGTLLSNTYVNQAHSITESDGNRGNYLLATSYDLDTLTNGGRYYVTSPVNGPGSGAWHVDVQHGANGNNTTQQAINEVDGASWWRVQNSNIWQAWQQVATMDSPALTGTPTAPTAVTTTDTTQIATTAFVQQELSGFSGGASALVDLTDTNLTSLADGEILSYDLNSTKWINIPSPAVARQDYHFVATASQTVFSITYDNSNTVDVYVDGVLLKSGTNYVLSGGTTLTLNYGVEEDTLVDIYAWNDANLLVAPTPIKTESYATSSGQTVFSAVYNTDAVEVFVNGIKISESLYSATNGTSITLDFGVDIGTWVQVVSNGEQPLNLNPSPTKVNITATASQTVFTATYNPDQVEIFLDGVKLAATEYTATNGTSFILDTAVDAGTWVQVVSNSNSPGVIMDWSNLTGRPTLLSDYGKVFAAEGSLQGGNITLEGDSAAYDITVENYGATAIETTFRVGWNSIDKMIVNNNGDLEVVGDLVSGDDVIAGGDVLATGDVTAFSDIRVKENIEVIPNAMDKILQLSGYTFDRTDIETSRQTGVIAQEVQAVLPEAVKETEDGTLSVAYGNMVGLLIEGMKEQSEIIKQLEDRIKELEKK